MSIARVHNRLYDIAWVIFLIAQFVTLTAWYALNDSPLKVTFYKAASLVSCALFAAVIVIGLVRKIYNARIIVVFVILAVIFALSWHFSRNNMLIWSFLVIVAAHQMDSQRLIRISSVITAAGLVITILISQIIRDADYIFPEGGRDRHGLGFNWTSVAPTLLFFLGLQYIFLRKEKLKFWELLILEAANVYLFIMTDTNMPFLLMSAYILFFMIQSFFKRHFRLLGRLKVLYWLLPALICIATVALYLIFDKDNTVLERLNVLLNYRLGFGSEGLEHFGITPFGREIFWIGNSIAQEAGAYNYVDCSYIQILLNYGVVFLAAVTGLYTWIMVRADRNKDFWLVFICIAVLLHSFSEPRLFDMTFNCIPVLAFAGLKGTALG